MIVTYDAATETWTIKLQPADVRPWARFRARLRAHLQQPVGPREAMVRLLDEAWAARRIWAENETKIARQKAYDAATAAQQLAAQEAADAARDAAVGFNPEAWMQRCDAVIVQAIVTEYDADGRPVSEQTTQPLKVFRAKLAPFLADVDAAAESGKLAPKPEPE